MKSLGLLRPGTLSQEKPSVLKAVASVRLILALHCELMVQKDFA